MLLLFVVVSAIALDDCHRLRCRQWANKNTTNAQTTHTYIFQQNVHMTRFHLKWNFETKFHLFFFSLLYTQRTKKDKTIINRDEILFVTEKNIDRRIKNDVFLSQVSDSKQDSVDNEIKTKFFFPSFLLETKKKIVTSNTIEIIGI